MPSRPEGPKPYTGPVIIPGADGSVPVDPLDPTKGRVTPVASAIELTAGVTELFRAANFLNEHLNLLGAAMRDGFADIGALLEALIQDITHEVRDGDDSWLSPAVREFLDSRAKAREEADEAAAAEAEALKAQLEAEEAQLDLGG
jgi:hypothetical protein